jgi:autophagy-related protein 5
MADDKEILREVWEGKLPVCFRLAENEWGSNEPDEIYLMISRQTYFPLVCDKIQRHFSEYVLTSNKTNPIWLDYNGTPLKWNYQVGLLYDLYANEGYENSSNIPWYVNVHFEKCPDEILECSSKEIVESYYLSTVKEADALKHKGKIINEMQKKDHKQLWYGIQSDKFDQFWSINKKLMEVTDGECFKSIPFRIYQNDKPFVQKIFEPIGENGKKRTFEDLLKVVYGETYKNFKLILIQGITPSFETPIQWLSEHLSYPDNFLHICVK